MIKEIKDKVFDPNTNLVTFTATVEIKVVAKFDPGSVQTMEQPEEPPTTEIQKVTVTSLTGGLTELDFYYRLEDVASEIVNTYYEGIKYDIID